jgi:hypothetical protein
MSQCSNYSLAVESQLNFHGADLILCSKFVHCSAEAVWDLDA